MSHWLTFHEFGPVAPGSFSATRPSAVEQVERRLDRIAHLAFGRGRNLRAILEGLFNQRLKVDVGHLGRALFCLRAGRGRFPCAEADCQCRT